MESMNENFKYIFAVIAVLLLGACSFIYYHYGEISLYFVKAPAKEVHVHSDFSFYILGKKVDLTADKYQSSKAQILHPKMHFHDGIDTMIHRHAEGLTLREFLGSLGFTITNTCLTTDAKETYCTNAENSLLLFVNGKTVADIESYVPQEKDQILLYYGSPSSPDIQAYEGAITNDACLYSGTCPERGKPPFETCGLTCEI